MQIRREIENELLQSRYITEKVCEWQSGDGVIGVQSGDRKEVTLFQ